MEACFVDTLLYVSTFLLFVVFVLPVKIHQQNLQLLKWRLHLGPKGQKSSMDVYSVVMCLLDTKNIVFVIIVVVLVFVLPVPKRDPPTKPEAAAAARARRASRP